MGFVSWFVLVVSSLAFLLYVVGLVPLFVQAFTLPAEFAGGPWTIFLNAFGPVAIMYLVVAVPLVLFILFDWYKKRKRKQLEVV